MKTVGDIWDREALTPVQTRATLALLAAAAAMYAFAWGDLGLLIQGLDTLAGGQATSQAPMIGLAFLVVLLVGAAGHMFHFRFWCWLAAWAWHSRSRSPRRPGCPWHFLVWALTALPRF